MKVTEIQDCTMIQSVIIRGKANKSSTTDQEKRPAHLDTTFLFLMKLFSCIEESDILLILLPPVDSMVSELYIFYTNTMEWDSPTETVLTSGSEQKQHIIKILYYKYNINQRKTLMINKSRSINHAKRE